jgi:hypothetical protein
MSKIVERWLLFEYVAGEFTPLSKPFKTKEQAEKAREKYPERLRKTIGLGVIRIKKYVRHLSDWTTTSSREWTPVEGAPGRAARSPAPIAADVRLLSAQQGSDTSCRKTEWLRRKETTGNRPGRIPG